MVGDFHGQKLVVRMETPGTEENQIDCGRKNRVHQKPRIGVAGVYDGLRNHACALVGRKRALTHVQHFWGWSSMDSGDQQEGLSHTAVSAHRIPTKVDR